MTVQAFSSSPFSPLLLAPPVVSYPPGASSERIIGRTIVYTRAVAVAVAVAVGIAVEVTLAVAVPVAVAVSVALAVGVSVGVTLGVALAVAVTVALDVAVGVGVNGIAASSNSYVIPQSPSDGSRLLTTA